MNDSFFSEINNQEKAYFLGFLYADGSNNGRNISLEIVQEDAHILERLVEALDSNIAPKLQKVRDGERPRLRLSICNKQIVSDLSTHTPRGAVDKNKTFKIRLPILADLSLYRHFLRGYTDGDGTIYVNNKRRVCRASLVSNSEFCLDVKDLLANHLNVNAYIGSKHGTSVKALEVSGTQQTRRFLDWIYEGATVYLERKYKKYLEVLKMSEQQGCRPGRKNAIQEGV